MHREAKSGCDKSCLHRDVPSTPHPITAMSALGDDDDVVENPATTDDDDAASIITVSTRRRRDNSSRPLIILNEMSDVRCERGVKGRTCEEENHGKKVEG